MTGEHNSQTWTQSDAFAEVVSTERCHFVLETSPPDYVKKISRFLESSVGQSSQDKVSNGPAEADSDSGDSLFITQRPVPEAVRSGRRRHSSLRSKPASPRDHEESEEDNSSSASPGESRTDKEKRRKTYTLPKYSFPFLAERKHRRTLLPVQNASLHKYVMGGFFKCVRELWQGYQRGVDEESFLPTVDIDGEDISPLSEEDEEMSEEGDITVVERKCFAAPSKAKSQQTWCNQLKQQRRRRASDATQETSQGRKTKVLHKIPAEAAILKDVPVSDTESSHNGESSCRVVVHRERNDEHAAANGNFLAQTETPKSKRRLRFEQKAKEEELRNDNDATVCGPRKQLRSSRQITQKGREASSTAPDVLHTDDVLQAGQPRDGPESQNLQKKKKAESVEDGKGQSQDEPEGLHAAACVNMEVEETNDELQIHEKHGTENYDDTILRPEERGSPDSKHKKERRKKNKPAVENVRQEVDGNVESDVRVQNSVFSVSCNMEEDVKEKKKKKKKKKRTVEQLQSVAEPRNDDAEIQKKKKKKRKKEKGIVTTEEDEEALDRTSVSAEQLQESGNCLENAANSQETLESSYVKRKKRKKKRQSSSNDATQDREQGVDVSVCSDDPVTWADGSGMSLKKTKRESMFCTPDEDEKVEKVGKKTKEDIEDQDAELVTKKKKKKKKKEMSSVSVQEKEKKRTSSFLFADAEENNAQTHGEQISPSQSRVSGAEKPAVSAGDLEEVTDGVTKKKRKRLVEKDFEEPNKACQSVLPETPDTGVKRKKKHTGSSAGLSPADEAVVLKKKKCKHRVIQEGPPAATEDAESVISALNTCSSVSHKKKGKHGRSAEISHDSSASDRATEETPNVVQHDSASSEMTGNQALNNMRDNKKKRKVKSADDVLLEGKLLSKSAEFDPRENKKKERNEQSADPSGDTSSQTSHSKSEMSSDSITKNSHRKVKRKLHNPSEDFLTDY